MLIWILFPSRVARVFLAGSCVYIFVVAMCGGVDADVRSDFALLPLYGVRLVTYVLCSRLRTAAAASLPAWRVRASVLVPAGRGCCVRVRGCVKISCSQRVHNVLSTFIDMVIPTV